MSVNYLTKVTSLLLSKGWKDWRMTNTFTENDGLLDIPSIRWPR